MSEMTYERTKELEVNIKIKEEAERLYADFKKYVVLKVSDYKGRGLFECWSDQHNAMYFQIKDGKIYLVCDFLNNQYNLTIHPEALFDAIKNGDGALEHFTGEIDKAKRKFNKEN